MQSSLVELKEQELWLRNYYSRMLEGVVRRIDSNRRVLRALAKKGHKVGKLSLASQYSCNSFTYNRTGFRIEKHGNTDLLWLSKIGYVQIRLHRQVFAIKQITVCKNNSKWHAIVCCEATKPLFKLVDLQKSIGLDVGITKFVHDSDNNSVDNPLFLKTMLKPLRRADRRLSRRRKGSRNWQKAKTRLQLLHERIRNKRSDFLHKLSTSYSKKYDVLFLERLGISRLMKNRRMARSIADSSWRTFKQYVQYKARLVVEVDPYNSSVACSKCGNKVPKPLAMRVHRCDRCGLVIDRDYNASLNIRQRGLQKLLMGHEEVTPVKILSESMKQEQTVGQPIAVHFK